MRRQLFIKTFNDFPFGIIIEINNQISAKNHVEHRQKRQPAFILEIDAEKIERFANFIADFIGALILRRKKSGKIRLFGGPKGGFFIHALLGMLNRFLANIVRKNFDPRISLMVAFFNAQHGDGIGFFAGRAAGAPDFNRLVRFLFPNFRDDFIHQRFKLIGLAEEIRLFNGNDIHEFFIFFLAGLIIFQIIIVFMKRVHRESKQPALQTSHENILIVVRDMNPGVTINNIPDKFEIILGIWKLCG